MGDLKLGAGIQLEWQCTWVLPSIPGGLSSSVLPQPLSTSCGCPLKPPSDPAVGGSVHVSPGCDGTAREKADGESDQL